MALLLAMGESSSATYIERKFTTKCSALFANYFARAIRKKNTLTCSWV